MHKEFEFFGNLGGTAERETYLLRPFWGEAYFFYVLPVDLKLSNYIKMQRRDLCETAA